VKELKNTFVFAERRRTICMGQQATRLSFKFILLGLRYNANTVRYTCQALWRQILPRNRHADQFAFWITSPNIRELGILAADNRSLHSGFRRGK